MSVKISWIDIRGGIFYKELNGKKLELEYATVKKNSALWHTYRIARRIVIAVMGATILLTGITMIVIPGPSAIVIAAGLAVLSLEFAWARRWLKKIKKETQTLQAMLSEQIAEQKRRQQITGRKKHYNILIKTRVQALGTVLSEWFARYKRRRTRPSRDKCN